MTTGTISTLQMSLEGLIDRYSREQAIELGNRTHQAVERLYDHRWEAEMSRDRMSFIDEPWFLSMGIDRQVSISNEFALSFQQAQLIADPEISTELRVALADYEIHAAALPIVFRRIGPEDSAAAFRGCTL